MNHKVIQIYVLIFLIFSCGKSTDTQENSQQPETRTDTDVIKIDTDQFELAGMKLGNLSEQTFYKTIESTGTIDVPPQYKVNVTAKMGGFIKETTLLEGDEVTKGQFLVSIENPEFVNLQQKYLEIKEQLNYLENEFNRQKTLFDEEIISEKSYLQAESNYRSAVATAAGLKKQLELLNISIANVEAGIFTSVARIYSPINGSITHIEVSKGSYVSPSTSIMRIVDNSHIHLELSVFEKDILKVKEGQPILFKVPEATDELLTGTVHLAGKAMNENRTVTIHGHPDDENLRLLSGMFVNASIAIDSLKGKALPNTAFAEDNDELFILKLVSKSESGYEFERFRVTEMHSNTNYKAFEESDRFGPEDEFLVTGAYALIGE